VLARHSAKRRTRVALWCEGCTEYKNSTKTMPRSKCAVLGKLPGHVALRRALVIAENHPRTLGKGLPRGRRHFRRLAVSRLSFAEYTCMTLGIPFVVYPRKNTRHTPFCRKGVSRAFCAECNTRRSHPRAHIALRRVFGVLSKDVVSVVSTSWN
jgi:hypothetical protein